MINVSDLLDRDLSMYYNDLAHAHAQDGGVNFVRGTKRRVACDSVPLEKEFVLDERYVKKVKVQNGCDICRSHDAALLDFVALDKAKTPHGVEHFFGVQDLKVVSNLLKQYAVICVRCCARFLAEDREKDF